MLELPVHIAAAHVDQPALRYAWDEWDVHRCYRPADAALQQRLHGLTRRATLGYMLACGEWVAWRLAGLHDRDEPMEVLEAGWAAIVDRLYTFGFETDDDEWRGPVLGPLNIMMTIIVDALHSNDHREDPAVPAAWMSRLAEHVLPDTRAFRRWQESCLVRLHRVCQAPPPSAQDLFDHDARDGDPVPRELYDPNRPYDPGQATQLIARFLEPLEDSDNYFLGTPEEMLDAGFVGVPYRWPPVAARPPRTARKRG
ncbi:hypothetical protein [Pseudorhodoferax sp. Leaf267]|uniref:hypothetical protein n=1 Tax=Pseudorhodoferax sp. Leaf267 TaxID=1736316 RepID=UPI0006F41E07|nr:hypothetical protein [Pseudorhodoferax sp. Leaf267]KQP22420.1 hypothetical protein ASF43_00355 [Pseudorhodoferax sp. Leaf267]